jgi:hypothetical protein
LHISNSYRIKYILLILSLFFGDRTVSTDKARAQVAKPPISKAVRDSREGEDAARKQGRKRRIPFAMLVDLDYLVAEQREGLAGVEVSEADLLILVAREVLLWFHLPVEIMTIAPIPIIARWMT